jgi:NagD protein
MAAAILGHLGLPASEVLMIGDRLLTDVGLARTAGMVSGLALTGATTLHDAETAALPPDLCLARLTDIIPEGDDTPYQLLAVAPEART